MTRRALHAGLTPNVAEKLDTLMSPATDRAVLIRLQNNIFALGRDVQIARTKAEPGQMMLTFRHNIVYWDSGVFTETAPVSVDFAENLYQCIGDSHLKFGNKSWDQWRLAGQDMKSIPGDAGLPIHHAGIFR